MTVQPLVRDRILQLSGERNLTIHHLAIRAGMPPSSVKSILYGRSQNPTLATLWHICDGLGVTLSEFFSTEAFDTLYLE